MPTLSQLRAAVSSASSMLSDAMSGRSKHDVVLNKTPGVPLGFRLRYTQTLMIITEVLADSAVATWNEEHPDKRVFPCARIFSVNGHTEPEQMLRELHSASTYLMQISRDEYGYLLEQMHLRPPNAVLPISVLQRLPIRTASDCNITECSICCADLSPAEKLVQLPCGHAFHSECVGTWLTKHHEVCPLCMKKVAPSQDSHFDAEDVGEVAAEAVAAPVHASQGRAIRQTQPL
eukprot:TRINITY_DN62957_c0_g1_i1.p1 TRINITY_DN62957_c0_g1~~TRINITY_DN62957_c0_g1_i1.p1  ORF type:complete len:260 (+),score=39.26 TRINITY_DN62957_c0_g1_i1:84-782(+)